MSDVRLNPQLRRDIRRIVTFHTFGDWPPGGMTAELVLAGVRGCWALDCGWQGNIAEHQDHVVDLITQALGVRLINALVAP